MNQGLIKKLAVITEEEKRILAGETEINKELYSQSEELVMDSEKFLHAGKLIEIRPHTRFVHFPKHRHNYIEVIYMCQGTTTHMVNGQKIVLNEGDLLFLNQQAVQEIFPAREEDIAINFIILPEFFDQTFTMLESENSPLSAFLMGCLFKSQTSYSYLYFNVAEVLPIQNLVENMVWSLANDLPNRRSINQKTMTLLLLQLMNHSDKIQTQNSDFKEELAVSVLRYIDKNYKEGSLTELAQILNYDLYWLSKEIKKQTGKTFKEILQEKKLAQAAYLLNQTKLSVAEIIVLIGYENTSFFYRKFKEHYGVSPKKYRDQSI